MKTMKILQVGDFIAWTREHNLCWEITSINEFSGDCTLNTYEKSSDGPLKILHTGIESNIDMLNSRIVGRSMVIINYQKKIEIET